MTTAAFALARHLSPDDPLLRQASFQWLWLAPALLACRYGVLAGFVSVAMILVLWILDRGGIAEGDFPRGYFVGGLVLTFLCGQFAEIWSARLTRSREATGYLNERLGAITRNHYLLRLSHERLQQDMLVKPVTLRESLARIRAQTMAATFLTLPRSDDFLRLVGQLCQLEVATFHAIIAGKPELEPLARLGESPGLQLDDPLVQHAIEHNELAHVQSEAVRESNPSRYLVCAPAIDSNGAPRFFLAVERMPFMALTAESLQILTVMLGYYADSLSMARVIRPITQRIANIPPEFALELARLTRIARQTGLQSSLAALVFERANEQRDVWDQMLRLRRSLDVTWEIDAGERRVLLTIMSLCGPAALESYLLRIEKNLRERFGIDFEQGVIVPYAVTIDGADPAELARNLLERCRA